MTQRVLVVDLELLGRFGVLIDLAYRRFIFSVMFIVAVIVVIYGAARRVLGEKPSQGCRRGCEDCVCMGHARVLMKIKATRLARVPLPGSERKLRSAASDWAQRESGAKDVLHRRSDLPQLGEESKLCNLGEVGDTGAATRAALKADNAFHCRHMMITPQLKFMVQVHEAFGELV